MSIESTSRVVFIPNGWQGTRLAPFLADKGCTVYCGMFANIPSLVRMAKQFPEKIFLITLQQCNETSVQKAVQHILNKHPSIDVLINLTSSLDLGAQPVETWPVKKIQDFFNRVIFAPIIAIQAVLPAMKKARTGKVFTFGRYDVDCPSSWRDSYKAAQVALGILVNDPAERLASDNVHFSLIEQKITRMADFPSTLGQSTDPKEVGEFVWKIINTEKPETKYLLELNTKPDLEILGQPELLASLLKEHRLAKPPNQP